MRASEAARLLRRNWFAIALVAVFIIYLFFHLQKMGEIGFNWLAPQKSYEIYLASYPKVVAGSSSFTVFSNFNSSCDLCGSRTVQVHEGENEVQFDSAACPNAVLLECNGRAVSFSFSRACGVPRESVSASVRTVVENRSLFINADGEAKTNGYKPLEIFIDGQRVAAPLYSLNGPFAITEKVPISPGKHVVEVRYLDRVVASTAIEAQAAYPLAALAAAILAVATAFFYRGGGIQRILVPAVLLVVSLVFVFRLAQSGVEWLVPVALLAYIAYLAKKTRQQKMERSRGLLTESALFGLAFAAVILAYSVTISSYDVWGAYYFRHAQETFAHGTTNYYDELSYLGRPFTYPPIFFEFAAQLTGILAQASFEAVRLPLDIFLAFAFGATTYLLFRNLGPKHRLLASLVFISQWAILLTATGIGLHIFALTLLNISLILIASSPFASVAALGFAFAAHPLVCVFFPFYLYATNGFKFDLRRFVLWPILAAVVSLPFYLPIFLRAGLPYEIVPGRWGYLLSYGLDGMRFDFQFLLPLLAGCALYGIATNRYRLHSLLLLALLLFNTYVSLRSDLIVAMVGAGLFPLVFANELKGKTNFLLLLALFILPNFLLGAVVLSGTGYHCSWGLADELCSKPMEYLATRTPGSSRVALDPIYGHLEAWKGGRPVLADLYVEYADYGKWKAENEFFNQNGNYSAVENYSVTLFMLHDFYNTPRSVPFDRAYDNGYMRVFRKPA